MGPTIPHNLGVGRGIRVALLYFSSGDALGEGPVLTGASWPMFCL
jgi:hypothetical protein